MKNSFLYLFVAALLVAVSGCAQYDNNRGVEVTWQDNITQEITVGKTTRKDVLTLLGPPSQVISMDDESVLYYLYAHSKGEGLVLIVYNRMEINTRYDRAIFFFDDDDILTEFATHIAKDASEHSESSTSDNS